MLFSASLAGYGMCINERLNTTIIIPAEHYTLLIRTRMHAQRLYTEITDVTDARNFTQVRLPTLKMKIMCYENSHGLFSFS